MKLEATHLDALMELVNIGCGRAAAALAEMTRQRITLGVPHIHVLELAEAGAHLEKRVGPKVACVNQAFAGPFSGNAMLLLDVQAANALADLLHGNEPHPPVKPEDTVGEAGNVLLNACLGVFGNLLEVQISFRVPELCIKSVGEILRSVTKEGKPLTHAVIAETRFSLPGGRTNGYVVLILGMTSLNYLVDSIDRWDRGLDT